MMLRWSPILWKRPADGNIHRNGLLRSVCEGKPQWLCDFMREQ